MHRRGFLALGAALLAPACGQQAKPKVQRVVWMGGNDDYKRRVPVAFAERGFRIGETLSLDFSGVAPGYAQTIDSYDNSKLREIVASRPDVMVVHGTPEEALKLTRDIPVVFYDYFDDPQARGYVQSLRRPGANATGASIPPGDLMMKQWQLLKMIRPRLRIGARIETVERFAERQARAARNPWLRGYFERLEQYQRDAGVALGIDIRNIQIPRDASAAAIALAVKRAGAGALGVVPSPIASWNEFVRKTRIPTFLTNAGFEPVQAGRVMLGWDFNTRECETQAVAIVARILRGESPATIPVYVIREYRFAVNTRLAREAGVEIPASVLIQADKLYDS